MADGPSTRRGEMKDSASFSETGSDIGDNVPQDKKEDDCENDNGFVEDRFRVDRKKLEQMLQGTWEQGDEAAEDFFQRIMDETNTQISWPSKLKIGAKSKKDPHIKVTGLPEDVREAKELLLAVLDTKSNRATLKMDVSHTDHSHVIGKGGNNIKRVMQDTGCHIHFPDSNRGSNVQEKSNQVSIAGQPDGVETARVQIRELLPLVFMFELAATTVPQPLPDVSSPAMQQFQQQYRVSVSFRQRARGFSTSVIVRGSVCNEKLVKEATRKLIDTLIGTTANTKALIDGPGVEDSKLIGGRLNLSGTVLEHDTLIPIVLTPVPVSMQLEIAPQHHLFIIGRGGMNIKQIMQATGAVIHFPDPNTVTPQRKGTVYIQGTIDSVFLARQHLIGCLPLVLMFDVKEEIDMDQGKLTQLMEQLDVFISVKPKPKQPSKSVIVKSIERNASNMYVARLFLMGLQKELPHPPVNQTNNGLPASALGLTALGYFGQTIPGTLTVSTVNAVTTMAGTNQILLMNGHTSPTPLNSVVHSPTLVHSVQSPPAVIHTIQSPVVIGSGVHSLHSVHSPTTVTNHVQSPVSVNSQEHGHVHRQLVVDSSKVHGQMIADNGKVHGQMIVDNSKVHRQMIVDNSKVHGQVIVDNSKVHGQMVMDSINVHGQSVNNSVHHQEILANQVLSAKVINSVQQHQQEVPVNHLHSPTVINSVQRQEVPSANVHSPKETRGVPSPKPVVNSASAENSPRTNPASASGSNWVPPPPGIYSRMMVVPAADTPSSVQNTLEMFNQCSLADLQKEFNQNSSFMRVPPQLERGSTRSRSETNSPSRSPCSSPLSFRDNSRTVDLAGLSTSNSFGKIVTHEPSSLTNSGHTMDLLGLSKTTSPPMNEVSFLHSSLNGSLHSSLNRSSLPAEQPSPPDLRAPGIERKNSSNNLFCDDYPPPFSVEYERKKLLANKAMQQKAIGESRIPTDFWSGLGFSKSMPESAIRERMAQQGVKQRYESPMATTYENTAEEMSEIDRDPWKDSVQSYNRPINPAPGEYPSPRKKYEYGLSTSNHIDGALVPTKSLWSPKTDLAELFSKLGLGKYTDLFQQQEIDLQTFLTLTDKDLRELGISTFGARRKMLLAIADMNKRRTLQSVNAGFDGPGHMNNPFETAEPQHVSRSDIASMSGRW